MFETVCTLPFAAEVFAQTVHPSEPLLAVGLSSGHVSSLRLPPAEDEDTAEVASGRRGSNGTSVIDTVWRTRRHKGSCRSLCFSLDGNVLYSSGTDGIVKAADTTTGKVTGKVAIPFDPASNEGEIDAPSVLHALSPQTLLLGTDSGALHLYDLRDPAPSVPINPKKTAFTTCTPAQTHRPHADYISSLTPLPPSQTSTSGYSKQFLTTGGTTLALTDLRRGVLVKSEDQEELLLSSVYVTGLAAKKSSGSTGEKSLVGGGDGVITLWEKGQWDDQDERIIVSREKETLDCMALMPENVGGFGKNVAVGLGDGTIRFVRLGANKVTLGGLHDEFEGVVGIDFDIQGRMISCGGSTIKVWEERDDADEDDDVEETTTTTKRAAADSDEDSDGEGDGDSDSSEEEAEIRKRRKKRKRGERSATQSTLNFAGLD